MIAYVDHLREHFLHPVQILRGRYLLPQAPGCSIEMQPASLAEYTCPTGPAWQSPFA